MPMRRLLLLVPAILFAGLAGVMGWLLLGADNGHRDARTIPSALIGKPVPTFKLPAINASIPGGLSTTDLKGQTTIVNVFASWCVPCLAEHPVVSALAAEGIPVYAINYKDEQADAARWLRIHGDPYKAIGSDLDGRVSIDWGVTGVPETYIVDAKGIIRYKYAGPLTPELVDSELRPVLRKLGG